MTRNSVFKKKAGKNKLIKTNLNRRKINSKNNKDLCQENSSKNLIFRKKKIRTNRKFIKNSIIFKKPTYKLLKLKIKSPKWVVISKKKELNLLNPIKSKNKRKTKYRRQKNNY